MTPLYWAWGCTLVAGVLAVLRVVWLVSALPLGYHGKLRVLRTIVCSCCFTWN